MPHAQGETESLHLHLHVFARISAITALKNVGQGKRLLQVSGIQHAGD